MHKQAAVAYHMNVGNGPLCFTLTRLGAWGIMRRDASQTHVFKVRRLYARPGTGKEPRRTRA